MLPTKTKNFIISASIWLVATLTCQAQEKPAELRYFYYPGTQAVVNGCADKTALVPPGNWTTEEKVSAHCDCRVKGETEAMCSVPENTENTNKSSKIQKNFELFCHTASNKVTSICKTKLEQLRRDEITFSINPDKQPGWYGLFDSQTKVIVVGQTLHIFLENLDPSDPRKDIKIIAPNSCQQNPSNPISAQNAKENKIQIKCSGQGTVTIRLGEGKNQLEETITIQYSHPAAAPALPANSGKTGSGQIPKPPSVENAAGLSNQFMGGNSAGKLPGDGTKINPNNTVPADISKTQPNRSVTEGRIKTAPPKPPKEQIQERIVKCISALGKNPTPEQNQNYRSELENLKSLRTDAASFTNEQIVKKLKEIPFSCPQ